MNIKKIPYGDSDYGKIIKQNKLYISGLVSKCLDVFMFALFLLFQKC
ncbi:hypothetical protein MHK_003991 [Candidatus Magnetomorum sp. HK-1]|nr:hypothetical protein MHK_003991 [Candidatus Magnetomorum sp. HK-1]